MLLLGYIPPFGMKYTMASQIDTQHATAATSIQSLLHITSPCYES